MIVRELLSVFGYKVDKGSEKKVKSSTDKILGFAKAAAAAYATFASVKIIGTLVDETAKLGDQTAKTAAKLGIAADLLQKMRFAADHAGVSQGELDNAMQSLIRRSSEAAEGTGLAVDSFRKLGVTLKDSNGNVRDTKDILADVADGLQNTKNSSDRVKLAFDLFGRSGVGMINVLKDGSEGLSEMMKAADDLGGVMSDRLLKLSEEYVDSQTDVGQVAQGVKNLFAEEMLPAFINAGNGLVEFVKANRQLIKSGIQGFGKQLVAIFNGMRRVVSFVASTFYALATAIQDSIEKMGPTQKGFLKIAAAAAVVAAALLLPAGPVLVLIGLVGLLIDDFAVFKEGGVSVTGAIVEGLGMTREGFLLLLNDLGEFLKLLWEIDGLIVEVFIGTIVTAITTVIDLFTKGLGPAIDNALEKFSTIGSVVKDLAAKGAKLFGIDISAAASPGQQVAAGRPGAGGVTNSPTMNSNVNVTISGAGDPQAVADQVSAKIRDENERQLRRAQVDLLPASGA